MERPILFSAPMVRAILAGTKTQTRRIIKPQPSIKGDLPPAVMAVKSPYGVPFDRLWVRETWSKPFYAVIYFADGDRKDVRWRPSIHMPRTHCRLVLEVRDILVERLQDISEEDALAEGIEATEFFRKEHPPSICFSVLWNAINGAMAWDKNPWVWAVEFKVIDVKTEA